MNIPQNISFWKDMKMDGWIDRYRVYKNTFLAFHGTNINHMIPFTSSTHAPVLSSPTKEMGEFNGEPQSGTD